jgi:hypothetical protein
MEEDELSTSRIRGVRLRAGVKLTMVYYKRSPVWDIARTRRDNG